MVKTIILGDIHGRSNWKLITHLNNDANRFIFIGDYFDSFDISGVEQIHNFKEIIEFKKNNQDKEVILLIGNHCHQYFPGIGYTGTSGYQHKIAPSITQVLEENKEHLQMAYQFDNFLCTHAGVSETFLRDSGWDEKQPIVEFINDLWKYKPKIFCFNGLYSDYGDEIRQTPIWIRPYSLMKDSKKITLKQIVGHTTMKQMDLKKYDALGYYFVDTLGTSGEYLIIEDEKTSIDKI